MFYIILFAFCNEALNLVNLVAILPNFDTGVNLMCVHAIKHCHKLQCGS